MEFIYKLSRPVISSLVQQISYNQLYCVDKYIVCNLTEYNDDTNLIRSIK